MENEKDTRIFKILRLYLRNRFSSETEEKVQHWIINEAHSPEKEKASLEYWDELPVAEDAGTYAALERVNRRIGYPAEQAVEIPLHTQIPLRTQKTLYTKTPLYTKKSLYTKLFRVAAVLIPLLLIGGGYLFYIQQQNKMIEISVAYGDPRHVLLPDSSEIWIHAGTNIRYPRNFASSERVVQLDGEAYFSVKKDQSKPFIVQTQELSVKVLGTKFNVKAYAGDEKITTTLTSGKVEVNTHNHSRVLQPNEQLTYDCSTSAIEVVQVPAEETDSWLSGQLLFHNSSLAEIIQTLERRFGVSITNQTKIPASKLYTVKFVRNETLDEILDVLEDVVGFSYQREGTKILWK